MITSYFYKGHQPDDPWQFEETALERVNLLVGTSGSGKTRYLNTIFNFATTVVQGKPFRSGYWKLSVQTYGYEYIWEFDGVSLNREENQIEKELVKRRKIEEINNYEILIERTKGEFIFCGEKLPKLQKDMPSVTILKEEEKIWPLYQTFARMQRRSFHDEGLKDVMAIQNIPLDLITEARKSKNIHDIWKQEHTVNAKLFLLKEVFPDLYKATVDAFKQVFTMIQECDVRPMKGIISPRPDDVLPVFAIKEKGIEKWIMLHELSSGMQKVLLIITDILTLPKGSIYIIDEYENSLGINAIDFLPNFLIDHGEDIQFFITTHHPYLINSMPIFNWRVFHRTGSNVSIKSGIEFEKKYGKSKQKVFIQLINDPFYSEGIQ